MLLNQRRIQNSVKHLRWSFAKNSEPLKAINYFCEKFHLRCLTRFRIRLCKDGAVVDSEYLETSKETDLLV